MKDKEFSQEQIEKVYPGEDVQDHLKLRLTIRSELNVRIWESAQWW